MVFSDSLSPTTSTGLSRTGKAGCKSPPRAQDRYVGGDRRMAFLAAAAALAHVYIGFAVLAETATSGPDLKSGDFQ
jgi:hypothetical protein